MGRSRRSSEWGDWPWPPWYASCAHRQCVAAGAAAADFLGRTATVLSNGAASMLAALSTPLQAATRQPRPRQSRSCSLLWPNPARRPNRPCLRRCQSAPHPGQRAGASNPRIDSCSQSGAAFTRVWQRLPAEYQAPLSQPCAPGCLARMASGG